MPKAVRLTREGGAVFFFVVAGGIPSRYDVFALCALARGDARFSSFNGKPKASAFFDHR